MLALADYKNNRATEILDNYDELFVGGLKGKTMAEKTEALVSLLGLDDKAWDNNEKLPEEARKKLAEDTYAGFMKKLKKNTAYSKEATTWQQRQQWSELSSRLMITRSSTRAQSLS